MLSDYLIQAYLLFYIIFILYPDIASPPLSYISTFFLVTNILMLALVIIYLILLRNFEREIGSSHFGFIYFLTALAGNLGLLSIYYGTQPPFPIFGATSGIFGVYGALIARHPWDPTVIEGLPMVNILGFILLTAGHILLFGKLDFLPIIMGIVYGYWLPATPNQPKKPMPSRRF